MKKLKLRKGYALYILLGVVLLASCNEKVVVDKIQKVEMHIDTTHISIHTKLSEKVTFLIYT